MSFPKDHPARHVEMPASDWTENRKHVLAELERLSLAQKEDHRLAAQRHDETMQGIAGTRIEIAGLKGRAAVWGGIAAIIVEALIAVAFRALGH